MRALIMNRLANHAPLQAIVPANRWYPAGSVDEMPTKPFGVVRISSVFPGVKRGRGPVRLEVWIHDERGSYVRIDAALKIVKDLLGSSYGITAGSEYLATTQWDSDSPDLFDDGHRTNTRMTSWILVGRS